MSLAKKISTFFKRKNDKREHEDKIHFFPPAFVVIDNGFINDQVCLTLRGTISLEDGTQRVTQHNKKLADMASERMAQEQQRDLLEKREELHRIQEEICLADEPPGAIFGRSLSIKRPFATMTKFAGTLIVIFILISSLMSANATVSMVADTSVNDASLTIPSSALNTIGVFLIAFLLTTIYGVLYSIKPEIAGYYLLLIASILVACLALIMTVASIEAWEIGGPGSLDTIGKALAKKFSITEPIKVGSESRFLQFLRIFTGVLAGSTAGIALFSLHLSPLHKSQKVSGNVTFNHGRSKRLKVTALKVSLQTLERQIKESRAERKWYLHYISVLSESRYIDKLKACGYH